MPPSSISPRFSTYFMKPDRHRHCDGVRTIWSAWPAGYGLARLRAHKGGVVILSRRITPACLSHSLFLLFHGSACSQLWPQIIITSWCTVAIVIWIIIWLFRDARRWSLKNRR